MGVVVVNGYVNIAVNPVNRYSRGKKEGVLINPQTQRPVELN